MSWGSSCIGAAMYTILKFVLFQGDIVALKKLKMEREKEGFPITSLREINTLLKAQHPNIVTVRVSALLMPAWFLIFSVSSVIVLLFFFCLTITLYPGTILLLISPPTVVLFLITQCSSPKGWLLTSKLLPCDQRRHFRCVSWHAKSSLCRQPFNFLSCMCKVRHMIRKQN